MHQTGQFNLVKWWLKKTFIFIIKYCIVYILLLYGFYSIGYVASTFSLVLSTFIAVIKGLTCRILSYLSTGTGGTELFFQVKDLGKPPWSDSSNTHIHCLRGRTDSRRLTAPLTRSYWPTPRTHWVRIGWSSFFKVFLFKCTDKQTPNKTSWIWYF